MCELLAVSNSQAARLTFSLQTLASRGGDGSTTLGAYRPVGQIDSEHAFCVLMSRLRVLWEAASPPPLQARLSLLTTFAADLRALGPANFLYAAGTVVPAPGVPRHRPGRR